MFAHLEKHFSSDQTKHFNIIKDRYVYKCLLDMAPYVVFNMCNRVHLAHAMTEVPTCTRLVLVGDSSQVGRYLRVTQLSVTAPSEAGPVLVLERGKRQPQQRVDILIPQRDRESSESSVCDCDPHWQCHRVYISCQLYAHQCHNHLVTFSMECYLNG